VSEQIKYLFGLTKMPINDAVDAIAIAYAAFRWCSQSNLLKQFDEIGATIWLVTNSMSNSHFKVS
jgi:hypothetical protein